MNNLNDFSDDQMFKIGDEVDWNVLQKCELKDELLDCVALEELKQLYREIHNKSNDYKINISDDLKKWWLYKQKDI